MNPDERELSGLLKDTAHEGPARIEVDALLARRRRHRLLAPALAVGAVLAIAIPTAVLLAGDTSSSPGVSVRPHVATTSSDPEAAAIVAVETALADAPIPPHAVEVKHAIAGLDAPLSISTSPNLVDRARWWRVKHSVDETLAYLRAHPPYATVAGETGSSGGASGRQIDSIGFDSSSGPSLSYSVTPFAGGTAIRVDATTIWTPARPAWSLAPDSVASVDVTVVRHAIGGPSGGAPTVRRTLTNGAARHLAGALDALPAVAPEGVHSCPAQLVQAADIVVFHAPAGTIRMTRIGGGCAFDASVTAYAHRRPVYLSGDRFDRAVLAALGLPAGYGER
jgi:hypothetical protein